MAIADLQQALEILRRVKEQLPVKTQKEQRLSSNLGAGVVYLEDGIRDLRFVAHGIKPECLADEILRQLPLEG